MNLTPFEIEIAKSLNIPLKSDRDPDVCDWIISYNFLDEIYDISDTLDDPISLEEIEVVLISLIKYKSQKMSGHDNPWPLSDVLEKLIWSSEYLLNKKDYDGHCHEEIRHCINRGKEILTHLK
jgi:hypothetical protein